MSLYPKIMTLVSHFAQHLLKLDPQKHVGRLALYHYLKNLTDLQAPFSASTIEGFYRRALTFEYWQLHAKALGELVRADIEDFYSSQKESMAEEWHRLRHADQLQIVPIRRVQDLEDLVRGEEESRLKSGDQMKILTLSETQVLVLILSSAGTLDAKVYGNGTVLKDQKLRLLSPLTWLQYTSTMDLMPHVTQYLEGSLLTIGAFQVDEDGVHGLVTRGYTFQKFETFARAKMVQLHEIYYGLKRLERYYIDPQSDPFYQELVTLLEKANRIVSQGVVEHFKLAETALQKGRLALKNIFPNDKLLQLLVTHLEYGLSQRGLSVWPDRNSEPRMKLD